MKIHFLSAVAAAAALVLSLSNPASAQTSITVYGGLSNSDAPSVNGHYDQGGFPVPVRKLNVEDLGFFGASLNWANASLYFDAQISGRRRFDDTSGGLINIGDIRSITSSGSSPNSTLERDRIELGLRNNVMRSGAFEFFVTPFYGVGVERTGSNASIRPPFGELSRSSSITWQYLGADTGVEYTHPLVANVDFVGTVSGGAYEVFSNAGFDNNANLAAGSVLSIDQHETRGGFRTSGRIELRSRWSQTLSSSIFGQATYWTDVPYAAFPTATVRGAAHSAFRDLTEYRIGVAFNFAR